jgi:molecular chaperone HtpG
MKGKKDEEITTEQKDKRDTLDNKITEIKKRRDEVLKSYGLKSELVKQLVDLALLSNNMLKGEDLTKFVKRSVDLIK